MGVWLLSSFFGNYFSGFPGTFWTRTSHEAFFLILTGLGIGGGIAIRLLARPMERVVAENGKTASKAGD
jgi:POT family proton-dependent oligopeptide transporter